MYLINISLFKSFSTLLLRVLPISYSFAVVSFRLLELAQRLLDSAYCLYDILIACGVTHTETIWVSESVTSHCGHVSLFQEIHSRVCGIVDGTVACALAIEAAAFWEEIEGSLWHVHLKTRTSLANFTMRLRRRSKAWRMFSTALWSSV